LLQKPAADKSPHITWCLTGHLTFLPMHSAGLYGAKDQAKIFDYVVSSYTPTLAALLNAKHGRAPGVGIPRLLAVSQPATPYQKPLLGTVHEVDAIQKIHCSTGRLPITRLDGRAATVAAVLQSMKECNWVHLACHGVQDDANATNSAFLFDGPLTLKEIMKQSFSQAELAILSACQTAKGDSKLPEEAIHLAAGMLAAGYGNVVAYPRRRCSHHCQDVIHISHRRGWWRQHESGVCITQSSWSSSGFK
jgi:CHAT domain-containing protein